MGLMSKRSFLTKLISLTLIASGLYKIAYSSVLMIFVYPRINLRDQGSTGLIEEGLIEKAIIYWITISLDVLFAFFLIFKPPQKIRPFHLAAGALISLGSIFFIVRTPLTEDPFLVLLEKALRLLP